MELATFLAMLGRWGLLVILLLGPSPGMAEPILPFLSATTLTPQTASFNQTLLRTALAKFFQTTAFRTESTIAITATTTQASVNLQSQTETLTVLPRNFHSRLQLGSKNYEIISNGQQVWMLDLAQKKYAILSFQQFQDSDDSFLIGLGTSFLLEMAEATPTDNRADLQTWLSSVIDFFTVNYAQEGLTLSQAQVSQQGLTYSLYQYQLPQENLTLVLWIDEQSQTLAKLQILGQEEGMAINIEETIHRQQVNPVIPHDAFQFRPPAQFTQVEELPLDPF